ncbi:MAG: sulfotransferase [Actinomycetota bacterium]
MSRPVRNLRPVDQSFRARLSRSATWKARRATASRRSLPDFVITGGQRCGTTSLYESLAGHSHIDPSLKKEIHYFDLHIDRGEDWYRAHFPLVSRSAGRLTFEATPNYLASVHAPKLMKALVPDVKLITLLRDPVERTYSSWKLRTYEGAENRPFATAVRDELAGVEVTHDDIDDERRRSLDRAMRWAYVEKSRYDEHFDRWFEFFDREQFLILKSEALFADPSAGLAQIEAFLGIDHDPSITLPHTNFTPTSSMDASFRQYLREYFAPHNERLTSIAGVDFGWA